MRGMKRTAVRTHANLYCGEPTTAGVAISLRSDQHKHRTAVAIARGTDPVKHIVERSDKPLHSSRPFPPQPPMFYRPLRGPLIKRRAGYVCSAVRTAAGEPDAAIRRSKAASDSPMTTLPNGPHA